MNVTTDVVKPLGQLYAKLDRNLLLGTPRDATAPECTSAAEHEPELVRNIVLTCQRDLRSLLRKIADYTVAVRRAVTRVYRRPLLHRCRQWLAGNCAQLSMPIV
jgi:hypothetical protein